MALRPQSLPPVPEATAAAVQAAFPKGNLYVALRAEFGSLYNRHYQGLYCTISQRQLSEGGGAYAA
jgi:hypothetical protein